MGHVQEIKLRIFTNRFLPFASPPTDRDSQSAVSAGAKSQDLKRRSAAPYLVQPMRKSMKSRPNQALDPVQKHANNVFIFNNLHTTFKSI
jgi:hypothetical protein